MGPAATVFQAMHGGFLGRGAPLPRLGWILFQPLHRAQGRVLDLDAETVASWWPRQTQIYAAEAYAVFAAIWAHRADLHGHDLICFIDNEAAAAAHIRGASPVQDVGAVVQAT